MKKELIVNEENFFLMKDLFLKLYNFSEDLMQHSDIYDFKREEYEKIITTFGKMLYGDHFVYHLLND